MPQWKDIIVLRDGQASKGKALITQVKIKTSIGTLVIKKSKIVHIHFRRRDGTGFPPTDEIKTVNGDDFKGEILGLKTIPFTLAATEETIDIDKDITNTLMFLDSLEPRSKRYPRIS
jgi:hypothetical protein